MANNKNACFKIYEGVSHNFTKSFGYPFEQGHVLDTYFENHVDDTAIRDIADFVHKYK